ncbi:hypothetical protein FRC00_009368, partial [Tulasnella sp. 408]
MATESYIQAGREFNISEIAEELQGELEVPDEADVSGGHAEIYCGTWTDPQGEKIQVAVKVFKNLIPKNQHTDRDALKRKVEMILQAACGLEHLHSLSPPICHSDIKPENVLINDRLEAVLSDFGLSRVLIGLGLHTGFTTSNATPGTIRYMAREILAEGGSRCNLQSDVYAFGGLMLALRERIQAEDPTPSFFRLEEVGELEGRLEIPDAPELSANSDVYHGIWNSPSGEQVEVAIK